MDCAQAHPVLGAPAAAAAVTTSNANRGHARTTTVNGNSIKNYFGSVPGATTASRDSTHWLPLDRDAGRPTRRLMDGSLRAMCNTTACNRKLKGIKEFAPGDNLTRGVRTRAPFFEAYADYEKARADRDVDRMGEARCRIEEVMTKSCAHCRGVGWKSKNRPGGQWDLCRQTYVELLAECGVGGVARCVECGTDRALSLEHTRPEEKTRGCNGKKVSLSFYSYWSHKDRGPEAMRDDALRGGCITLCMMCHKFRETGNAGRRVGTVAEAQALPEGAWNGTPEETAEYMRKHNALEKAPRYEYNDALKHAVGGCENPSCRRDGKSSSSGGIDPGTEVCFEWNHLDKETKPVDKPGDPRTVRAVCGSAKRLPEEDWKARIDADRSKCELLCVNCHFEHTNRKRG